MEHATQPKLFKSHVGIIVYILSIFNQNIITSLVPNTNVDFYKNQF